MFGLTRPKDAQMDLWLQGDLSDLESRALLKGGIDPDEILRDPVTLTGPRFSWTGGADFGVRRGWDDKIRFTPVNVTIVNFLEHQLMIYQCALDMLTGNPLNESVKQYFYNHVVSVGTEEYCMTLRREDLNSKLLNRLPDINNAIQDGKLQLNSAKMFELRTAGGNSVKVVLKDPRIMECLGGGTISTTLADDAVQVIRKMLEQKISGPVPA